MVTEHSVFSFDLRVRSAKRRVAVTVGMKEACSRLSNSRHCYPLGETFGEVGKTNQVMMCPSEPVGMKQ